MQPRPRGRAVPGTRGLTTHAVGAIPLRTRTGSALWLCDGVGSNAAEENRRAKTEKLPGFVVEALLGHGELQSNRWMALKGVKGWR